MKTAFRKSFVRDLKKIKVQQILDQVRTVIEQVETAESLRDVGGLKKLQGATNSYRIRVGDYRIGIEVEQDMVEFVRCLPRRDIYRSFP